MGLTDRPYRCRWHFLANDRGVTYLAIMLAIVLMGISLTAIGKQWRVAVKRDHEAELMFRGLRIKQAIEAFAADYETQKTVRDHRYPLTLEEMTKGPKPRLQVAYKDPVTGGDFELIRVEGFIYGVKSRSLERPMSRVLFKDAKTYREVEFRAEAAGNCGQGQGQLGGQAGLLGPMGQGAGPRPGGPGFGMSPLTGAPSGMGNPVQSGLGSPGTGTGNASQTGGGPCQPGGTGPGQTGKPQGSSNKTSDGQGLQGPSGEGGTPSGGASAPTGGNAAPERAMTEEPPPSSVPPNTGEPTSPF